MQVFPLYCAILYNESIHMKMSLCVGIVVSETLIVKVVVSKNIYFLFFRVIRQAGGASENLLRLSGNSDTGLCI